MATSRIIRPPRVLVAHRDAAWVARARQRLEELGYSVTDCLELDFVPDLLRGPKPFDLAAVSSEIDPSEQIRILKSIRDAKSPTKLMLLLDNLDSASMHVRGQTGLVTHRVTDDVNAFALAVAGQIGPAPRPPAV
jgi:hypothetical protein